VWRRLGLRRRWWGRKPRVEGSLRVRACCPRAMDCGIEQSGSAWTAGAVDLLAWRICGHEDGGGDCGRCWHGGFCWRCWRGDCWRGGCARLWPRGQRQGLRARRGESRAERAMAEQRVVDAYTKDIRSSRDCAELLVMRRCQLALCIRAACFLPNSCITARLVLLCCRWLWYETL
jgi:hypothetical protein